MKTLVTGAIAVLGSILAGAGVGWWWFLRPVVIGVAQTSGRLTEHSMVHEGRTRTWLQYTPANQHPAAGLMLVLHGAHGSGSQFRTWTGHAADALADRHGFAVVYADGVEGHWNDCRKLGRFRAKELDVDDVGFLEHVIDSLVESHGVDPQRVVVLGYSNGGQMALRLALEGKARLAGLTMIGATVPTDDNLVCAGTDIRASALLVAGTNDRISPYDGGHVVLLGSDRGTVRSVADSVRWISGDSSAALGASMRKPASDRSEVLPHATVQAWQGRQGQAIHLLTIQGGGHTVPQPWTKFPRLLGVTHHGADAFALSAMLFGLVRPN